MSKNLIPIIAKELGVEIGEEFGFETDVAEKLVCRFTDKAIQMKNYTEEWVDVPLTLNYICQQKVIKLPFEPKMREYYWTYNGDDFSIVELDWSGHFTEYCRKACGCVFRTEKEAIKARPEVYKRLTGKEWKGNVRD